MARREGWSSLPPYHPDYIPPPQRDPRLATDFPEDENGEAGEIAGDDDDDVPLTRVYSHLVHDATEPPPSPAPPPLPDTPPWSEVAASMGRAVRVRRGSEGYEVRPLSVYEKDSIAGWYAMSRGYKAARDGSSGEEGSEAEREEETGMLDSDEEDSLEGFVDDY
jgi:hypothetical protein